MAVPKIYTETPRLPKGSTIRFSRIHPEPPPPPLPPRPLHYSPRRPPQIPTPLLPSASVSPPPTPSKKAPWIMVNEPPPDTSGITLHRTSWSMLVFGTITMLLCFLGIAQSGRRYYLDSSLLSGFTTLLVGLLGLRARNWTRLPNRNFVTGYIVLAVLSGFTAAGLVVLLATRNLGPQAAPITDMMGGAECGIALLTLLLAVVGVAASGCCHRSPPDNRISHCAEGLTL